MNFLLIPSPFLSAASWALVLEILTERGHTGQLLDLADMLGSAPGAYRRVGEAAASLLLSPSILVVHSGAGSLAPSVVEAAPRLIVGAIFVDALLPHPGRNWFDTAPSGLVERIRADATSGWAAPWPNWMSPKALRALLPDDGMRTDLVRDAPRVALTYLEQIAPATISWLPPDRCAYLRLSEGYMKERLIAEELGWRTVELPVDHLAIMTRATLISDCIETVARGFRPPADKPRGG